MRCFRPLLLVVVVSSCAFAHSAAGQGSGDSRPRMGSRTVDIDEAMSPSFTMADLAILDDMLDLDAGQSLVIETLLEDYVDQFSSQSQSVRVRLLDARPGSIAGESLQGMQRGQVAMQNQMEQMRKQLSDRIRQAQGSEERAKIRKEFSRQMAELTKQQESIRDITGTQGNWTEFLMAQASMLREWNQQRRNLDKEFVDALGLVLEPLGPDEARLLSLVRASIKRRASVPRGRLDGERIDVVAMFNEHFADDALRESLAPVIDAYAIELARLLELRDAFRLDVGPALSESLAAGDWDRMQAIIDEEVVLRTRIRDLNLDTVGRLISWDIPGPTKSAMQAQFRTLFNASNWQKGRFDRAVDAAAELDELSDSQLAALESLRVTCGSSIDEVRAAQDVAYRESSAIRWVHEEKRGWVGSFPSAKFEGVLDNTTLNELKRMRQDAEARCMGELKELLGQELYVKLPGTRTSASTGSRPQSSRQIEAKKRRDEIYRRFDSNGDGKIDADERTRMREEMTRERSGRP